MKYICSECKVFNGLYNQEAKIQNDKAAMEHLKKDGYEFDELIYCDNCKKLTKEEFVQ